MDPHLGRIDYCSLSDQTLMELFIDGLGEETQRQYQRDDGTYCDFPREWRCVYVEDDKVMISLTYVRGKGGSLQLSYLPQNVRALDANERGIEGSVYLTHLPANMDLLRIHNNQLTGSIDLAHLPAGMGHLSLNNNQFEGSIDLTKLPEKMQNIFLNNNRLEGSIDLSHLPKQMRNLDLESNQFTGSFVATNLPMGVRRVSAGWNQFHAIAVVDSQTKASIHLMESGVTSVVDENGNERMEKVTL